MLLEMKHITKVYNGTVVANNDISIHLDKGEILAIVGENGAGKSTIMKILYGLERPTGGEIYLNGIKQYFNSPQDAICQGIGMVQQNFMLFQPFSVAENIVYGNEPTDRKIFFNRKKAEDIVRSLCQKYGLSIDPTLLIADCPVGLQQRVEILKVLYQNADIIIFDEPSAVLTPQEVKELLKTIAALAALDKSIILITHKLSEVMAVADRVVVMRNGKKVDEMAKCDTSIEALSYSMVGRKLANRKITPQQTDGIILDIKHLCYQTPYGKKAIDDLSMTVKGGEIVGIAGVSGNGQSDLIHLISGLLKATSGDVFLNGVMIGDLEVAEIRKVGLSYIPEDRYKMGCAKQATLTQVGIMGHYQKPTYSKNSILKLGKIDDFVNTMLCNYDVKFDSKKQHAGELSGGNIQKLIVAREIEQYSKLLIAAEPTRGVDIGAMEFIHAQLLKKRARGDAVLLVSSELTEIMALSDRIYVMYEGKINGEFLREDVTSEALGLLMAGGI